MTRIFFYLLLFFTYSMLNTISAARFALVMAKRAIVYADKDLESPIGYIQAGKKVMIGETERNRGTVISTVIAGRIAWLRLSDLSVEREDYSSKDKKASTRFTISEEEFRDRNEQAEDTLFNNNYLYLSYGILNLDENFEQFSNEIDVEPKLYSNNINIEIVHRTPYRRTFWSVGLGIYSQSHDEYQWTTYMGQFTYYWSLIKSRVFTIDLYGGIMASGDFQMKTNFTTTGLTSNESGNAYGYKFGGQLKLFPYSGIGLIAGISNQQIVINELGPITSSVNPETELNSIGGVNIYFGLTWGI
jgi:hypothetical protein